MIDFNKLKWIQMILIIVFCIYIVYAETYFN